MMTYILFVPGFVLLLLGGHMLVDGAIAIARRLGISDLVVGLTVVAFGTSAPELLVNVFASATGNTEIAIGNAIGSNIMNTFLILGIAAVVFPLTVGKGTVWKEIPMSLVSVAMVPVLANNAWLIPAADAVLSRTDGLVLCGCMALFLLYVVRVARAAGDVPEEVKAVKGLSAGTGAVMVVFGIAALSIGANWIVDGAVALAKALHVSDTVIALTIVSIGTSLPELAASVVAARKKNADMAVGNVVGSNIFNMFWVLGASSTVRPLPFQAASTIDAGVAALGSALLFLWAFVGFRRRAIERYEGVILLVLYAGYLAWLVMYRA